MAPTSTAFGRRADPPADVALWLGATAAFVLAVVAAPELAAGAPAITAVPLVHGVAQLAAIALLHAQPARVAAERILCAVSAAAAVVYACAAAIDAAALRPLAREAGRALADWIGADPDADADALRATLLAVAAALALVSVGQLGTGRHRRQVLGYVALADELEFRAATTTRSLLGLVTFAFATPLVKLGYARPLESEDLFFLKPADQAANAHRHFLGHWGGSPERGALMRSAIRAYGPQYVATALFRAGRATCQILLAVYCLPALLDFLEADDSSGSDGAVIVALFFGVSLGQIVCHHMYFYHAVCMAIRLRDAFLSVVVDKTLRMSVVGSGGVGLLFNLVSNDCTRLLEFALYSFNLHMAALECVVILALLVAQLGLSALPGVSIIFLFAPLQGVIGRRVARQRARVIRKTDGRVRLLSEVLNAIHLVKLCCWEALWARNVAAARKDELAELGALFTYKNINQVAGLWSPMFATTASFSMYILLADDVDSISSARVFSALALFSMLRVPLSVFPAGVKVVAESLVTLERLSEVLERPEVSASAQREPRLAGAPILELRGASFAWQSDGQGALHGVDLEVAAGELVAVAGLVGAGKSSLLQAILGEMPPRGKATQHVLRGTVGYVAQEAWIENATFRDNILFGAPFDPAWYRDVCAACQLDSDIALLPAGDDTEIGERGVNLSGGQKARLSLARCLYARPDLILLDDPLAAVDASVGSALFHQCIRACMAARGAAVVLVTHQLQFLPVCDRILVMDDGRIVDTGSYEALTSDGTRSAVFQRLVDASMAAMSSAAAQFEAARGASGDAPDKPPAAVAEAKAASAGEASLTTAEERSIGQVDAGVYSKYAKLVGGWWIVGAVLASYAILQGQRVGIDFLLSRWVEDPEMLSRSDFLMIYGLLTASYGVFAFVRGVVFYRLAIRASTKLHRDAFRAVLASPISFFETTPTGRLLNRFSSDIDQVDDGLPDTAHNTFFFVSSVGGGFVLILVVFPQFALALVPLAMLFLRVQNWYRWSSRELKRLEGTTRSPVFAHLSATLQGLPTIRATQRQAAFATKSQDLLDGNHRALYSLWAANRWLGMRLDFLCICSLSVVVGMCILFPISASLAGLLIVYTLTLTSQLQWALRQAVELETKMTSVERLAYFDTLDPEEPAGRALRQPPRGWPSEGAVEFRGVALRYRVGLPLVLRDVSFALRPGERVGVVGRTGAGKSSLLVAMFRLAELAGGSILIDGVDVGKIRLEELRRAVAIIPQTPTLLSGTIRSNLVGELDRTDGEVWAALRHVALEGYVAGLALGLSHPVEAGGASLSVGQRQLLCIARALLRRPKVLFLDEATSAVDSETDAAIGRAVRGFKATVVTIAHRLQTIADSDRVIVMEKGRVAEIGAPTVLLEQKDSLFRGLVDRARLDAL